MNKIFILSILMSLVLTSLAQTEVHFINDHAGNRIYRNIVIIPIVKSDTIGLPKLLQENISLNETSSVIQEHIKIFPNPTGSVINVIIPSEFDKTILCLYTQEGKIVLREESFRSQTIDLSPNEGGIYYLALLVEGNMFTYKIIKQQ